MHFIIVILALIFISVFTVWLTADTKKKINKPRQTKDFDEID